MLDGESRLQLPPRPAEQAGDGVAVWRDPVTIDSYLPEPPSRYLHQLPGDGILPLRAFLRVLCRRGYAGLVTLDLHPRALGAWWPPAARHNLAAALAFCRLVLRDCTPSPPLHLERRGEASEAPAEAENEG